MLLIGVRNFPIAKFQYLFFGSGYHLLKALMRQFTLFKDYLVAIPGQPVKYRILQKKYIFAPFLPYFNIYILLRILFQIMYFLCSARVVKSSAFSTKCVVFYVYPRNATDCLSSLYSHFGLLFFKSNQVKHSAQKLDACISFPMRQSARANAEKKMKIKRIEYSV